MTQEHFFSCAHPIMKKLAKLKATAELKKFHANDPDWNGYVIPWKLPNGTVFHGSHKAYNEWITAALGELMLLPDAELLESTDKLNKLLIQHIQQAYSNNKTMHVYFKYLDNFRLSDLDAF